MSGRWYIPFVEDRLPVLDDVDCRRTLAIVQARMFGEQNPLPTFDRFVVLRRAGEGAMGRVYVAHDPSLDREVAIKVIRIAGDLETDRSRRLRLEREARAAARISHPNVVTIHEVGVDDESLFVVMEYVPGQTLREWLESETRSHSEVIRVFSEAGRGLAAAHAQGLVHRDFKPDNVLVGEDGRIRVVDFGLVQISPDAATNGDGSRQDVDNGQMATSSRVTQGTVGTPAYMSPEQRAGENVDARSDQFSFCLTLHEALLGPRPRPGVTLPGPQGDPKDVPGWVVEVLRRGMKQRPEDRYDSMPDLLSALAVDPAAARRRRRRLVGGAALLIATGVGLSLAARQDVDPCPDAAALIASTWSDEARREVEASMLRTELEYTQGSLERVGSGLDAYAQTWVEHRDAACRETRVSHQQPDAVMVSRLGCLDDRRRHLAAAIELLSNADAMVSEHAVSMVEGLPRISPCSDLHYLTAEVKPPDSEESRASLVLLEERLSRVHALSAAGKYEPASGLAEGLLRDAEALEYPPFLAASLLERGRLYGLAGDHAQQRSTLQRSFYVATAAGDDRNALEAALELVYLPGRVETGDEDLQWAETAQALIERDGGELPRSRADLAIARGRLDQERGAFEQSLQRYAEGLDLYREDPSYRVRVGTVQNYIAGAQLSLGNIEESVRSFERALEAVEEVYGADHPRVATVLTNLAMARRSLGALDDAVAGLDRAYAISTQAYGRVHPKIARILGNQAALELDRGRPDAARAKFEEVVAIAREVYGPDHRELAMALNNLGFLRSQLGRYKSAEEALGEALTIAEELPGAKGVVAAILNNQGIVHSESGRGALALEAYERSLHLTREMVGDDHPDVAGAQLNIGNVLVGLERYEEAQRRFQGAHDAFERVAGDQRIHQADATRGVAVCLWKLGDAAAALQKLSALRAVELEVMDPDAPTLATTLSTMGEIEAGEGRHDEAQLHFEAALAQLGDHEVAVRRRTRLQLSLARSLWAAGDDRQRARTLALRAQAALNAAANPDPDELAQVTAWLETHPR